MLYWRYSFITIFIILIKVSSVDNIEKELTETTRISLKSEEEDKNKLSAGERNAKYERLCKEIIKFAPNLCDNKDAKKKCSVCTDPEIPVVNTDVLMSQLERNKDFKSISSYLRQHNDFINAIGDRLDCGKKPNKTEDENSETRQISLGENGMFQNNNEERIVGGEASTMGEWPWQVSLFLKDVQYGGGAILSKDFILTAAHLFGGGNLNAKFWKVRAGDHFRTMDYKDKNETIHEVKKIIYHPDFGERWMPHRLKGRVFNAKYDIAILQLKTPIALDHENKGRLCLPDNSFPLKPNTSCYISGWGNTRYRGYNSEILKHVHLIILPSSVCNHERVYNNTLHFTSLCAGYVDKIAGSCNGDSGGALSCEKDGRWYQAGVISGGYKCASVRDAPGIFGNVTHFKNWIISAIIWNADDIEDDIN